MAKMIPNFILDNHGSAAEEKVFGWFKSAPDDWVILHSYNIARGVGLRETELDFLVLAPGYGLFGIEVKGGRIVRKNGEWYSINGSKTEHSIRDPFVQVRNATYRIVESIRNRLYFPFLFGYGVIFPDTEFDVELMGVEADRRQIMDKNANGNVKSFIKNMAIYFSSTKYKSPILDENGVNKMINFLRPDFDIPVSLSVKIDNITKKQVKFTNEQFERLDDIESNERVLMLGEAGTGKTFLSIEHAVRLANQGKKVGLFCYNDNIGDWLKTRFTDGNSPVYAGSLHKFMYQHIKKAGIKIILADGSDFIDIMMKHTGRDVPERIKCLKAGEHDFWENEIPNRMLEALNKYSLKFDKIIIDEIQDLLKDGYLLVFDEMLEGGLKNGKWCMAGDELQSIAPNPLSQKKITELLDTYIKSYTKILLHTNCRNTKEIASAIESITNIKFSKVKDENGGLGVEYITFATREKQAELLERKLKQLHDEKIPNGYIVILSPYRKKEDSAVSLIQNSKIYDYSPTATNQIRFCDIKKFKGLESVVIILADIYTYTDIDGWITGNSNDSGKENITPQLLYTAMSRARAQLIVFESESARKERIKLIKQTQEDKK
jgi:hypothetical protein